MRKTLLLILTAVVAASSSSALWAADVADAARVKAVEHCCQLIRPCQLPDGMIRMRADSDRVRGVPYFANMAAVALLASQSTHHDRSDVDRVDRWLAWYAAHQRPDGTIHKYAGATGSYAPTEKLDTTDTSASLYLLTLNRYRRASGDPRIPERHGVSTRRAIKAVQSLVDPADGLTWARAGNRNKYLMDNILVSASALWRMVFAARQRKRSG